MKPGICDKHGKQRFTTASPKLCSAAKEHSRVDVAEIKVLRIESSGQYFDYFIDSDYLNSFGIYADGEVVSLKDREKIGKNFFINTQLHL